MGDRGLRRHRLYHNCYIVRQRRRAFYIRLVHDDRHDTVPTMGALEDQDFYLIGDLDDVEIHEDVVLPPTGGDKCGMIPEIIKDDTTLEVPGNYATIQDALTCLDNKIILNKATVTIDVTTNADTLTQAERETLLALPVKKQRDCAVALASQIGHGLGCLEDCLEMPEPFNSFI